MRIFLAGASGVIGVRLVPILVSEGHTVAGMTHSPDKVRLLEAIGAEPVMCDVYDATRLDEAVLLFGPDLVMHQLTDLPDEIDEIPRFAAANNRIRSEGTSNLLHATGAAGVHRFLAQSIAWTPPAGGEAVQEHERMVLDAGGVVLRYGRLYGPGSSTRTPSHRSHGSTWRRRHAGPRRCSGPNRV